MNKLGSQTGLPECKIIKALVSKVEEKKDSDLNFLFLLDELRKIISDEISRINLLFPEYTPHDEKYHLKKLFHIADGLLGSELIESMNLAELFVLSVSLYAHDWGMAISEDEKDYIIKDSNDECPYVLLEDEVERFKKFCKDNKIDNSELHMSDWQSYVRQTHAFRSGCRVRNYFEKYDSGIAEISARLCEGHYLDFEIIDDYKSYPTDYSLLRETVNVKALALYVRLVDLLDLGGDRTPYVLWKFVSPKNKFSKMEWEKHRALQPVSFSSYQTGRYIQVDGGTSDHNIYMALMDLRRYVNDQFKISSDILSRMNHSYHKLNLSHIDWRVAARGFKPIPIQFEFDRGKMFQILGDDIYQNDGYVFIRELIQNSIDAIRIRKEVLENRGLEFNSGKISVQLEDFNDLYYRLTLSDNGIGMDEYIVRNYLSIAGKSYYKSTDFEREGFKIEPISRFGIGILSCFMLSDYIEISTFRDPYISSNVSEKLKISIPAKENFFRVEIMNNAHDIGSKFDVYILKDKLLEHGIAKFSITDYIMEVAGFVDFPIEVRENNKKTVIKRPVEFSKEDAKDHLSISYDFPFHKAILPQNVSVAQKYFTEKRILLQDDLKLTDYEGCITYLCPVDDKLDIMNIGLVWPINDIKVLHMEEETSEDDRIKWKDGWSEYHSRFYRTRTNERVLSINKMDAYSVYLNGILLPEVSPPDINQKEGNGNFHSNYLTDSFLVPQLIVNVPTSTQIKIDLARTKIKDDENWDKQIWEALYHYIRETELVKILNEEAKMQFFLFGRLKTFYRLLDRTLMEKIIADIEQIPIPLYTEKNKLKFIFLDEQTKCVDLVIPCKMVRRELKSFIFSSYFSKEKPYEGFLNSKSGNDLLAVGGEYHDGGMSASLKNMNELILSLIRQYYVLTKIVFVSSPIGEDIPWIHEVYSFLGKKSEQVSDKKITNIDLIIQDNYQIEILGYRYMRIYKNMPKIVCFDSPFDDKLFFSWGYMNINHAFTKDFVEILIKVALVKEEKKFSDEIIGSLIDKINQLSFMKSEYKLKESSITNENRIIDEINRLCNDLSLINSKLSEIKSEDFVPNSAFIQGDKVKVIDYMQMPITQESWGETLK